MLTPTRQLQQATQIPHVEWDAPDLSQMSLLDQRSGQEIEYRLFRISEISEGPSGAYRLAMGNVLSSMCNTGCSSVYILSGHPEGIELYVGVSSGKRETDLHEAGRTIKAAFEGNFLGAQLETIANGNTYVNNMLSTSRNVGLITGIPTFNDKEESVDDDDFQGVERLANSLVGETWQLIIVADPASDVEIRETLEQIYDLSTALSEHIKHSVQQAENSSSQVSQSHGTSDSQTNGTSNSTTSGTSNSDSTSKNENRSKSNGTNSSTGKSNSGQSTSAGTGSSYTSGTNKSWTEGDNNSTTTGTNTSRTEGETRGDSLALTRERIDKRSERMQKHLSETLIERFLRGRSKGMFRTAIYVSAAEKATYDRLSRGVLSIYQGNQSSVTPLRVTQLPLASPKLRDLLQIPQMSSDGQHLSRHSALAHSMPIMAADRIAGATWLNTGELALIAGLPSLELPGLKIRKSVDFALNTGESGTGDVCLKLGTIIQHGRRLPHKTVNLPLRELNKHIFITGVTGAGKTTTCMKLLLESGLPFLVIEPAKTEYRALHGNGLEIDYYTLGREDLTPFRLNPFELLPGQKNLASHISTLNATLAAAFPMEAAMPHIVEEAIINAYKTKGWDIYTGDNFISDDPWAADSNAWPTFSDMIEELDAVIVSKRMGKEFEEKYRGSLVARLTNLTLGIKGRMLNTRHSLDFSHLLDKRVVIELEELKDEQDKALFMGLIIGRIAESMKQRHRENPNFQHLTLIEEAHRLLSRPEPGEPGSKKMGVDMFANLLAEVRKYGEGLVIADQIPNKLVADVIKNTNTKIVHRLFAADDRNTIGDTMGLSDEQKDFLPLLQPGETIIYCGGWHASVRVQINQDTQTDRPEIDENKIRQRGRQQIWEQREKLFPLLSAHPAITTPDILAEFLDHGVRMLNMLLKLNYTRSKATDGNSRIGLNREHLANKLGKTCQQWMTRLGIDSSVLSSLLARTLADCGTGFNISVESLEIVMPEAIQKVQQSLSDFDYWASTDRDAVKIFNNSESLLIKDSI